MPKLADLKPGDHVHIYGDVEAEIIRADDRTLPGDDEEWMSVRYRALATGLTGTFVWPAATELPLPIGNEGVLEPAPCRLCGHETFRCVCP